MYPTVLNYHNFKTLKSSSERFVEFRLEVYKGLTVRAAHYNCNEITLKIKDQFLRTEVMIHTEPCLERYGGKCTGSCAILEV